ncbi:TolC family protein [Sinomicrobium soli]|uniref:TolC family protein n=1 Tax=Sinomicrobium sp. N-1-3-6 TaxID=2219864 RepID=UPI000DCCF6BB|nr:TolC family protein [Sinomicrobium sp. N-1-3-6]RAV30871.1 TolC family protein [Sinomicrobium sp. N-1-3-6]
MKKIIRIISLVLLPFTVTAQTLDDYLQAAAENNPEVKASYARFEAAMQKAPQVSSLPDPTLTMSAFGKMIETRLGRQEAKFSLMQMFPWFGTLKAREDAATLMAEAGFQQYLDTREELFVKVKTVYAEMYELQATISIQEENMEVLNTFRELALSRFRNGKAAMVDVVRVDMKRNDTGTEIALLKDKRASVAYRFNALLNVAHDSEVAFPETLPALPAGEEMEQENAEGDSLFAAHPKMQQLDKQTASYTAQRKAAVKQGLPMLGIGIDYSIISKQTEMNPENNGQDVIMPMLSVSLPVFRKQHKARVKEADFLAEAARQESVAVRNRLRADYEMARYDIRKAQQRMALYDKQLESTGQAIKLLLAAYGNSESGIEEILRMQQEKLLYETAKVTAEKDRFAAQARKAYLLSED